MHQIYAVILTYFIIIFFIARYFSKKQSLQDYFLNNKSSGLWLLIFSNVATMIGAWAVITTMTATYDFGISFGITIMFSFLCWAIILWLLSKKIVRFWNTYGIYSIVDFFEKRFDQKNQMLVLIMQLIILLIWTTVQIVAITYLINALTGINYYVAIWISASITILYTAIGWLKIDIITDFIQFWIIIAIFAIMTSIWYQEIWWVQNLINILPIEKLNVLNYWGIWFFLWTIIFWGLIYIPNTSHRQRILSAKTEKIAKNSFLRSIPFLLLIMAMVIFLWLLASVILWWINSNAVIFELINKLLANKRLIWLWFAAILAIMMSSLDSILIAVSTITYKWFATIKKNIEKKWTSRARILTWWLWLVSILIAIAIPDIVSLSLFCSYLTLILVPSVIAGFYFPKVSSNASFYSILIPTILLCGLYFSIGGNSFIISTAAAFLIILFYDKIFKKQKKFFIL